MYFRFSIARFLEQNFHVPCARFIDISHCSVQDHISTHPTALENFFAPPTIAASASVPASASASASETTATVPRSSSEFIFPAAGWQSLQVARRLCPVITIGTVVKFFVDKVTVDGEAAANFKALGLDGSDSKSLRLFKRGYVQKVELAAKDNHIYLRARCCLLYTSPSPRDS